MKRLLLIVLLLAGCSAQANESLEVSIEASPTQVEAFEPVTIISTISFNGEPVTKNAEIEFEFINSNGQSIGTVNPNNNEDGTYSIETSFDGTGTYKIIAHVDYEELHEMPEVEVSLK